MLIVNFPIVTTSVISFSPVIIGPGTTSSTFAVTPSFRPEPITIPRLGNIPLTVPAPRIPYPFIPYPGLPTMTMGNSSSTSTTIPGGLWMFPTLPTTVITSGTITQTFSEDQITSLSSLRRTVQFTTSWVNSNSKGTKRTNTPVPIWIQTGGFYWSPIPLPGINPFPPLPPLGLPPLPGPPCFKAFGIFSIDCPPDKGSPSTHYTSGKPEPTCKTNCGTLDRSDDEESTSTCATETRRTCVPNGQCNTYVGCACPTTTATDYFVTCSSTSCKTTRSQVKTGCYVSASATTTAVGPYCPLDVSVGPDEEQGDTMPQTMTSGPDPFTPGSAVEGGQTVTANGDTAVVGGHTYTIPDDGVPTTITEPGGGVVTIYPSYGGTGHPFTPTATLPTLTSLPTGPPYSGSNCASYTASEVCNGSGGRSSCETQTLCVPSAPRWSTYKTIGSASCPGNQICIRTSIVPQCAQNAIGGVLPRATATATTTPVNLVKLKSRVPATVTAAFITGEPSALVKLKSETEHKKEVVIPDLDFNATESQFTNSSFSSGLSGGELIKRQGFGDDSCLYVITCKKDDNDIPFCATVSKVPCIKASIEANTGGASGTKVTATVKEDGVTVCQASVSCTIFDDILGHEGNCAGNPKFDCGGGNSMNWEWNKIYYTSKKYGGATYPLYLERTVTDKLYFCWQNVGLRALPAACIQDSFAYQQGPCAPYP